MPLMVWRHPRPAGAEGRCIGRTDVPVDRRRAKRQAHRIRAWARRHGAPYVVLASPLQRSAAVGRWLRRWGWRLRIEPRLAELDFGTWDGRRWDDIGAAAVDAWCADFAAYAPGGGEPVCQLLERCAALMAEHAGGPVCCAVGHAGWISAARWSSGTPAASPRAATWPPAVAYGERVACGGARNLGVARPET